ncbi:hypothetical protein Ddc_20459 [Ditylenchus destructor]|nr:hypothetical protein Ddc_20459 [Ditylenchus destructor]
MGPNGASHPRRQRSGGSGLLAPPRADRGQGYLAARVPVRLQPGLVAGPRRGRPRATPSSPGQDAAAGRAARHAALHGRHPDALRGRGLGAGDVGGHPPVPAQGAHGRAAGAGPGRDRADLLHGHAGDGPHALDAAVAAGRLGRWTLRNGGHFLSSTIAFVILGLPTPLLLMTAGLMAARLRLFSHPRWEPMLSRWSRRWLLPAIVVNIAFTTLLWPGLRDGDAFISGQYAIFYLYPTLLLLSAAVPAVVLRMRRDPRLLHLLAPLGRHTLTLYLLSSVLSFALFSGAGLAWKPGTVVVALLSLAYWGGGVALAHLIGPRRLPLEAWLSR